MRAWRNAVIALAFLGAVAGVHPVLAVQPDEILSDAALEARARALSRDLRCMVCQNQSIDDSDAPLARDLRLLVRERLKAGDSDAQVLDFLTARYGQFVLLKPRLGWDTVLLWGAPAAVLLAWGSVAGSALRCMASKSLHRMAPKRDDFSGTIITRPTKNDVSIMSKRSP